jgi:hypothetical protein
MKIYLNLMSLRFRMRATHTILIMFVHSHVNFGQDVSNLFFCHENINIRQIYLITTKQFIGVSSDLRSIYLFNEENFIKDTLLLSSKKNEELFQHLIILDKSRIAINTLNTSYIINTKNDRLETEKIHHLNFAELPIFNYSPLNNVVIGYVHSAKSSIGYKFVYVKDGELQDIFQDQKKLTNYNGSGQLTSKFYVDYNANKVYFPLEAANRIAIFDLNDYKTQFYDFPPLKSKNESWYYFFDHISNRHFAVNYNKDGINILHEIVDQFSRLKKIETIEGEPLSIVDKNIHIFKREREEKKELICHYFIPLFSLNQKATILEEVIVDH